MTDKEHSLRHGALGPTRRAEGLMSVGATLAGVVAAILDWDRRQRDMARLHALPDHMLDDIGLTRSDIGGQRASQAPSWQLWRG